MKAQNTLIPIDFKVIFQSELIHVIFLKTLYYIHFDCALYSLILYKALYV